MRVIYFLMAALCINVAVGMSMGEIQKYVKFNSVDSEIFMTMLCMTAGILFLTFSIQKDESKN